jgi:two-component system cell cycle sensor histidine kinase/response regulator CckA
VAKQPTYDELIQRIKALEREALERERAEETLRIQNAYMELLFESAPEAILWADKNHRITRINRQFTEMFGYSLEEAIGRTADDLIAPDERHEEASEITTRVGQGEMPRLETVRYRKDGSPVFVDLMASPVRDQGEVIATYASYRDVTGRKQAEEAQRAAEEKYRLFVESASEGIILSQEGRVRYINPRAIEFIGYSEEEILVRNFLEFVHPDDRDRMVEVYLSKMRGEDVTSGFSCRVITKDGKTKWVQSRSTLLTMGEEPALLTFMIDVTEQKQAEEALRDSEARMRGIIEAITETVLLIDSNGTVLAANPVATKRLGRRYPDELVGKSLWDFLDRGSIKARKAAVDQVIRTDGAFRTEDEREGRIYSTHWYPVFDPQGKVVHLAIFGADVTDARRLEAQLLHAQKMEAIGTLAGGIAHDFNNLLMGIQGNASLMLLGMNPTDPYHERLRNIEQYVQYGAGLTKQLLGFARAGKYEVKTSNLNELVDRSSQMFGRTKKEIRIYRKYQEGLWLAEVDQGQIEQVLLNIYVNAWQAMPGGGELYLQTENATLDKSYVKPFTVKPGKYVKISVTDSGTGMDRKTQERIFEPFFTTKEMGRGTGLGLASAYGIIKNHDGIINVYSEKGKGTTFNIYLPASGKEMAEETSPAEDIIRGTERILLVDDEEMIIDVGRKMLEGLSYEVLVSRSGSEAIETYSKNKDRIDLVVLDMIMPDMGGGETYDRLKQINPGVKVMLSTGYSMNGEAKRILDRGCQGFIQKPFNLTVLSQRLRECLDKK